MITLSVIKADLGGYGGHYSTHPALLDKAGENLGRAQRQGLIINFHVTNCGDDLELMMTHERGNDDEQVHALAWRTFEERHSDPIIVFMADKTSVGAWNLPRLAVAISVALVMGLLAAAVLYAQTPTPVPVTEATPQNPIIGMILQYLIPGLGGLAIIIGAIWGLMRWHYEGRIASFKEEVDRLRRLLEEERVSGVSAKRELSEMMQKAGKEKKASKGQ